MNKQEYLHALEKTLRAAHVQDGADILEEYTEHFDMKLSDGYTEEEIAAKLASPKDIADQFASIKCGNGAKRANRIVLAIGLVFADILVGAFFILLYAWVFVLGAFTIVSAGLGIFSIFDISLWNVIPEMPYLCALLLGLSLLALAVLSAIGTEYCRLYATQLLRVYTCWHKAVLGNGGSATPPLAMHPLIKARKRRMMRSVTLIALVVLSVCFIAALGSMMIATGSLEPWHVWHWFE